MMAHQPRPSRYASSTSQCGRGHALDQGFSWPVCQLYLVVAEPTGWRWAQGVIRCVFSMHPARSATLGAAAFEGAREERLLAVRSRGGGARRRREAAVRAMQPTGFRMRQGEATQRGRSCGRALRRGPKQMQARGGDARRQCVRCSPRASACGKARQRSVGVPAGGRSGGARSRCRREAATRGGGVCDAARGSSAHRLGEAAGRTFWRALLCGPKQSWHARRRILSQENSQSNEDVMNDGASGTARGASVRVCCRRCALNGASGGADAVKPTFGAAVSNGGASGTARGASVRVCSRRYALNGASGGAGALKPTCGAAVLNGGASGTARGATVRVCSRRCALNGASGGAAQARSTALWMALSGPATALGVRWGSTAAGLLR